MAMCRHLFGGSEKKHGNLSRYSSFRRERSSWSYKNTKKPYYYVNMTVQMRLLAIALSERKRESETDNRL